MATMLDLHAQLPESRLVADMADLVVDGVLLVCVAIAVVFLGSIVISLCRRARDWLIAKRDRRRFAAELSETERDILHL